MERCRVLRIEEQMYGCEELPEGAEVCCDVTVEAADGTRKTLSCPDAALIRQGIGEGDRVLWDGMELKKERNSMKKIETSALIGLGALGILFGRKMPGVKVIADAGRIARYSAQPVVCNGEECHFDYVPPEQGQPVDLLLVAVKATVLEQAIRDMKKFIGPDTIILSVLSCKIPVIKDRRLILIMDHFQRAAHNRCFHTAAANGADNGSVLKD